MGAEFPLLLGGQEHTPESVSALILRQLAAAACGTTAGRSRVVITVPPTSAWPSGRRPTRQASSPGWTCWNCSTSRSRPLPTTGWPPPGTRTVLVYDLGGGTFDTTVLQISGGGVTVLATDGHHQLGGADVDQRLLDLVLRTAGGRAVRRTSWTRSPRTSAGSASSCSMWRRPRKTSAHGYPTRCRGPHRLRPGHGHREPGRPGGGLRRPVRHHGGDHRARAGLGGLSAARASTR